MTADRTGAEGAAADFLRARRRADMRAVLAQLSGRHQDLLPFDEVRRRLHGVESAATQLEDIPLSAIIGSVGRYQDFTREFLPRINADRSRWVGVKLAMTGLEGVPPISVYRVGDAYFVRDGNHRVSVARQLGATHIQAYVTPVHTRVTLSPDDRPDDLIIKAEHASFLEETGIDRLRPQADMRVTVPGQYEKLLDHIHVHQYFMGIDLDRPVGFEEAVGHWYDAVFMPVIEAIRAHGLLEGFEHRTEADLYLFLAEHRARLEQDFGWSLTSESVASGIGETRPLPADQRAEQLLEAVNAEPQQRRERVRLVDDLLVLLQGRASDTVALHTGLRVAAYEQARIYALRIRAGTLETDELDAERTRFHAACHASGMTGQIAFTDADPIAEVRARAAYVDLVVAALAQGEGEEREPIPELHGLWRRCPRPLLVPSQHVTTLARPLLAYDGGPRSEEALFALAYAAVKRGLQPVVLTVPEFGRGDGPQARARHYLERLGVHATYVSVRGPVSDVIVEVADEHACDAVFMGSHKYSRWLEDMVGGVLDRVLRRYRFPILIT